LVGRPPVDIWSDPDLGWVVTYEPLTTGPGQLLMFTVEVPDESAPPRVTSASWAAYEGFSVPDAPMPQATAGAEA
jgi:hypothetical protein